MGGINQEEFDKIFSNWYEPVRNYIYYKAGDIQVAEDIAQDVFLKIWEKRETINKLTVKSLLFKIAGNLFLNRIERQKVSFRFISGFKTEKTANAPDFEMEMKEFDTKLKRALAELDEDKRTVFLMNRMDELTYVQIAENLGLSVKAIEKRMEKALAFLKKRIEMNI